MPSRHPEHQRDAIDPPISRPIYGSLIYSFLIKATTIKAATNNYHRRPSSTSNLPPVLPQISIFSKIVLSLHAVSNSTLSNYDDASFLSDTSSIQSVIGSLIREKMSDMSYKLSSPSTSNSGYTERELVGAKMSSLANAHDLSNMSYKLSSPSTSNSRYTERDLVGAEMSCLANAHDLSDLSSKLSFPSTSNGRYTERGLVGAEMSCLANAHDLINLSSKLSFLSTSNGRYTERDLVGAKMSSRNPLHKYSTSTSHSVHRSLASACPQSIRM
jgi:hypothetical protein